MPPGCSYQISNDIKRMMIANEENEGQRVKAVTFKLHEPLPNLGAAKCDLHRERPEGKIV
jgi:hypothetical protein